MPVNQEAQQRIVQKILENAPVDDSVRDQAWNAFFTAGDRVSFVQQFQSIPVPQSVKRQLWFAKFPEAYKKLPEDQRDLGDPELESFVRSGGKWIEAPLPDIINKEASRPTPSKVYTIDLGKLGIGKTPTEHIRPISEQEYRAGSKLDRGRGGLANLLADAIWGGYQIGRPGGVYEGMVSEWLKGLIGLKGRGAQPSGAKQAIPPVPERPPEPRPAAIPDQAQSVAQPVEQVVLPQAAPHAQASVPPSAAVPSPVHPESQARSLVFIDQPGSSQAAPSVFGPVPPPVPVQEAPKPVEVPRISLIPKFDKEVLDQVAKAAVEKARSESKKKESFLDQLPGWIRSAVETITGAIGPAIAVPEAGAPMIASGALVQTPPKPRTQPQAQIQSQAQPVPAAPAPTSAPAPAPTPATAPASEAPAPAIAATHAPVQPQAPSLVFVGTPEMAQPAAPVFGPVPPPIPVQETPKQPEVPEFSFIPKFDKEVLDRAARISMEKAKEREREEAKRRDLFWNHLPAWIRSAIETVTGAMGPAVGIPEAGAPMVAAGYPSSAQVQAKAAQAAPGRQERKASEKKASSGILDAIAEGIKGAIQSIGSMAATPEAGVPLAVPQNKEEMQKVAQAYLEALTTPVVPLSEMVGEKPGYWRGVAKAVEPMLSPLGVTSAGVAAPVMAASPAAALALGSAGAVAASIGLGKKLREAYEHVVAGRYDMAREALGEGTVDGVFAVLMAHAAKRGAMDVYNDLLSRYRAWRATVVPGPRQQPPESLPDTGKPSGPAPGAARAAEAPPAAAEAPKAAPETARPVAEEVAPKAEPAPAKAGEAVQPKPETVVEAPAGERVPPTPEELERMVSRLASEISPEETGKFTGPPRPQSRAAAEEPAPAEKVEVRPESAGSKVSVKERGDVTKEILGEQARPQEAQGLDPEIQRIIENYRWMSALDERTTSKMLAHIDSFGEEVANGWKMVQVGDRIVIGDPKSRQLVVFNSAEEALRYAKEHPLVRPAEPAAAEAESRPAREPAPETAADQPRAGEPQGQIMPEVQRTEPPRPTAEARAEREAPQTAGPVAGAGIAAELAGSEMAQQEPPRERIRTAPSESASESAGMRQLMPPSPGRAAGAGDRLAGYLASVLSDRNWPKEYDANTIYSSYRDLVGAIGESRAKEELARRGVPQQVLDLIGDPDQLRDYARSAADRAARAIRAGADEFQREQDMRQRVGQAPVAPPPVPASAPSVSPAAQPVSAPEDTSEPPRPSLSAQRREQGPEPAPAASPGVSTSESAAPVRPEPAATAGPAPSSEPPRPSLGRKAEETSGQPSVMASGEVGPTVEPPKPKSVVSAERRKAVEAIAKQALNQRIFNAEEAIRDSSLIHKAASEISSDIGGKHEDSYFPKANDIKHIRAILIGKEYSTGKDIFAIQVIDPKQWKWRTVAIRRGKEDEIRAGLPSIAQSSRWKNEILGPVAVDVPTSGYISNFLGSDGTRELQGLLNSESSIEDVEEASVLSKDEAAKLADDLAAVINDPNWPLYFSSKDIRTAYVSLQKSLGPENADRELSRRGVGSGNLDLLKSTENLAKREIEHKNMYSLLMRQNAVMNAGLPTPEELAGSKVTNAISDYVYESAGGITNVKSVMQWDSGIAIVKNQSGKYDLYTLNPSTGLLEQQETFDKLAKAKEAVGQRYAYSKIDIESARRAIEAIKSGAAKKIQIDSSKAAQNVYYGVEKGSSGIVWSGNFGYSISGYNFILYARDDDGNVLYATKRLPASDIKHVVFKSGLRPAVDLEKIPAFMLDHRRLADNASTAMYAKNLPKVAEMARKTMEELYKKKFGITLGPQFSVSMPIGETTISIDLPYEATDAARWLVNIGDSSAKYTPIRGVATDDALPKAIQYSLMAANGDVSKVKPLTREAQEAIKDLKRMDQGMNVRLVASDKPALETFRSIVEDVSENKPYSYYIKSFPEGVFIAAEAIVNFRSESTVLVSKITDNPPDNLVDVNITPDSIREFLGHLIEDGVQVGSSGQIPEKYVHKLWTVININQSTKDALSGRLKLSESVDLYPFTALASSVQKKELGNLLAVAISDGSVGYSDVSYSMFIASNRDVNNIPLDSVLIAGSADHIKAMADRFGQAKADYSRGLIVAGGVAAQVDKYDFSKIREAITDLGKGIFASVSFSADDLREAINKMGKRAGYRYWFEVRNGKLFIIRSKPGKDKSTYTVAGVGGAGMVTIPAAVSSAAGAYGIGYVDGNVLSIFAESVRPGSTVTLKFFGDKGERLLFSADAADHVGRKNVFLSSISYKSDSIKLEGLPEDRTNVIQVAAKPKGQKRRASSSSVSDQGVPSAQQASGQTETSPSVETEFEKPVPAGSRQEAQKGPEAHPERSATASRQDKASLGLIRDILQDVGIAKDNWYSLYKSEGALLFTASAKRGSNSYELNYAAKIADLPVGVDAESGSVKPDRVLDLIEKARDGALDVTNEKDISGYLGVPGRYPVVNRAALEVLSGSKPRGEDVSLDLIQKLSEEIADKTRDDYRAFIIEGGHFGIASGNVSAGGVTIATNADRDEIVETANAFIGDLKGVLAFAKFARGVRVNYEDGVISAQNVAASGETKRAASLFGSEELNKGGAPVSASFMSKDLKAAIKKMGSFAGYQYWFVPLEDRVVIVRTKYDSRKAGYYVAGKAGAGMLAIPAKVEARKQGDFVGIVDGSALMSFLSSLGHDSEVNLSIAGDESASLVMSSRPIEYIGTKNVYLFGGGLSAVKKGIKNLEAGYGSAMLVQASMRESASRPIYRSPGSGSSSMPESAPSEPQLAGAQTATSPEVSPEPQRQPQPERSLEPRLESPSEPQTEQPSSQYSEPPRPSRGQEEAQEAQAEAKPEQNAVAQSGLRPESAPRTESKPESEKSAAPASSEPPRPRKEKPSEAPTEKAQKSVTIDQQPHEKVKLSDKLKSEAAKEIARIAEESESLPQEQRVGEHSPEYATFRKRFAKAVDYIYSHRAQFETAGQISDPEQWMVLEALLEKAYRAYIDRRFKETMSPIELEYNARMMQVFPGIEDYVSADMLNSTQLSKIGEAFHPHTSTLKKAIADLLRALDRVGSSIAAPIPLRIDDLDKAWRQLSQESTKNLADRPPDDSAAAFAGEEGISEKPMGLASGSKLGRPQVNYWPPRYNYSEAWGIRLSYEQRREIQKDSIANVLLTVLDGREYSSKRDPDNAGYYFYNRRAAEWFADYIGGSASYDQFVSIIDDLYGKSFPGLVDLLASEPLAGYYKFRKVNFASSRKETKFANTIVINAVKSAGTRTLNAASLLAQALGGYAYSDGVYSFTNNEHGAQRFMNILETGMVPQEVLAYAASIAIASGKTKLVDALVSQIHSPAQDDSGETAWSGKGRVVAEIKDDRISKAIVQSCGSDWTPVGAEEVSKRYPDLLSYQADGVARAIYALDKYGGFLLMDGAGAGKTSQIMAVAKHYLDQGKKVVLISRANALKIRKAKDGAQLTGSYAEWAQRIKVPVHVVASPDQVPKELQPGKLYVGNYSHYSLNKRYPVDKDTILILDEAHALKNFDSNATLNAIPNIDEAGAVMYATATPIDQPQHIHYLKRIDIYEGNDPETALTKLGLVKRARAIKRGDKIEVIVEWAANPALSPSQIASRLDALFWRLGERGLVLRREISLRGVDVYMRQVDLPQEARDVMDKIEAAFVDMESPRAAALTLMHQRRQLETYKVNDVVKITKDELAAGRNVVIFASRINASEVSVKYVEFNQRTGERVEYKDVIHVSEGTTKLIKEALIRDGVVKESEIVEVHGNAEGKQSDAIDLFQSNKAKVMIATVESGGVGINLDDTTGARPRTMIVMTPPFDAVNNIQAICRVWRVNTKSYPKVYYLRGDHKVDSWNFDIISQKMKYLHAAVKNEVRRVDIESKDVLRAEELSARAREERVMNELLLYRGWPYEVSDIRMITELSDISEDELEKTIIALAKRGLLKLMDGVKEKPSDENRHRYVYDEASRTYYRRVSPNLEILKSSK